MLEEKQNHHKQQPPSSPGLLEADLASPSGASPYRYGGQGGAKASADVASRSKREVRAKVEGAVSKLYGRRKEEALHAVSRLKQMRQHHQEQVRASE